MRPSAALASGRPVTVLRVLSALAMWLTPWSRRDGAVTPGAVRHAHPVLSRAPCLVLPVSSSRSRPRLSGAPAVGHDGTVRPAFVLHEHHKPRHHFDLRLE